MFTLETWGAKKLSTFIVLLPDLYLGHASLVKFMRYHFESHLTRIFPKDFVLFSLSDTYMFAWERVFCPRGALNKGQSRNLDAVGIRMTRLVKQTRKKRKHTLYSRDGMGLLFSSGKHRISPVNSACHANFTGTSRYFTLRIFGGFGGQTEFPISLGISSYQSVTWASGRGKFPNRLRSHVLSVNSDSKNANNCKYGSLICFLPGNSILVGSCRFQIQFQAHLHVGKLEWWIYVWWFCTSLRFQDP